MAGLDRSAIGARLFLSPNTVRTHIQNVLRKLEVHSSIEAVGLALRHGVRAARARRLKPARGRPSPAAIVGGFTRRMTVAYSGRPPRLTSSVHAPWSSNSGA